MIFLIKQRLLLTAMFSLALMHTGSAALADENSLLLPDNTHSNIEFTSGKGRTSIEPKKNLQVFVGRQDNCCTGKSPIAGRYSVSGNTVTFDPTFDFITDQHYTVATYSDDADNQSAPKLREFKIRAGNESIAPEVLTIYPSGSTLPENTLRFYIHFSTPMRPHLSADFITLVDEHGKADTEAFMKFKQELWSEDRRRLTLLMDPGRLKRGVAQNLTLGPALLEKGTYSIVVKEGWPSATGQKSPRFERAFSVTSALRTLPDTELWKVEPPQISTQAPLLIKFDRPFDSQLAQSSIRILGKDGNAISGKISLEDNEKTWHFKPTKKWQGASIQIIVDARLEDVAGNNFKDLLDHSVKTNLNMINQIRLSVALKPVTDNQALINSGGHL